MSMPVREFPSEPDLTPRDAAMLAGCSYGTVLAEIRAGRLRAYHRAGRYAVRRDDFCEWAYGAPVEPRGEGEPAVDALPRRRYRPRATGNVSALRALEQKRGASDTVLPLSELEERA